MSIEVAKLDRINLQQRADRLRAELAALEERVRKIDIYIEMAQQYGGAMEARAPNEPNPIQSEAARFVFKPRGHAELVSGAVIGHLRATGRPAKTSELLDMLEARGLPVGGEKPRNNLSGILSRRRELVADRTQGWRLAEWSENLTDPQNTPDDEATSSTVEPQPSERSHADSLV